MKLRIKGNSVRVRLDRRDLAQLVDTGRAEDSLAFGPGSHQRFSYAVEIAPAVPGRPSVDYLDGRILIQICRPDVETWAGTDLVGFDNSQATDAGAVRLVLEKDFACVDRTAGEEEDDAWAFPNPSTAC